MFEKEIIFISDYSLNKIKALGAYFSVAQLNSTDLHPAITKYIDSELDYLIYLDRKELVHKSVFDYSNPEIVKYLNLITGEIKSNKKLSFEDARKLIIQAVSFTANFLVRPKWSLTKFIYNEDQLKTVDEIRLSLNYLHYYDYLKTVLLTYIEKKHSQNLSLIDFEVALNKIDKELFSVHTQKLVDNALFSIADFFNLTGIDKRKVSPNCVELFLKEKDLIDCLFRLRRSLPVNAKQHYEIDEIRKIIYTPTSLDKSEELPSRTSEKEEPAVQKPTKPKDETPEPEIKPEKKKEITEEEMFNFKIEEDNKVPDENVGEKFEEKTEEELHEEIVEESQLAETEDKTNINADEDEVTEEAKTDDLDSLLDDDLLSDLSSDDELLDAFDSQLKALEEESNMLLSGETELHKDDNSQKKESEEQNNNEKQGSEVNSDGSELEFDNKVQSKIELEIEEDNEIGNELELDANNETEKADDEQVIADVTKEEKSNSGSHRKVPQREKDLFSFFSNKEIEKIVVNVFNEDREDFANTMEKITECSVYDEATDILKTVFFSYRINPYTREAVTLTNAVSSYFNQAT